MDELLQEFLTETTENLETVDNELVRFEREPADAEILANIFRLVHTVKGSCGFVGLPRLESLAHAAETLLGRMRDGKVAVSSESVTATLAAIDAIRSITAKLGETGAEPEGDDAALIVQLEALAEGRTVAGESEPAKPSGDDAASGGESEAGPAPTLNQSIRVSVDLLEELMTSVSELVLTRNQLIQGYRTEHEGALSLPLDRLSAQIGRLQESVMRTRMQPISGAWSALPRMVRSLALDLGKKIDLVMKGGDTELDRQMLELVKDPLSHMVRNAADHGLETPEARQSAGKPEVGTIQLSAAQEGGHITITLADDGRGLDTAKLRRKAVEKGILSAAEAEAAADAQLHRVIFAPGFSTAETITSISGRGVGMDVVRANVEKIGGAIEVESAPGRGTKFKVRIPLTLAIMPALIVGVGKARFAIPQIAVAELVRTGQQSGHRVEQVAGAPVLRLRGALLPLLNLGSTLDLSAGEEADHVLVIRSAGMMFGILVDEVFDTEELVVKPVSRPLADLSVYSGNAILGDGKVIMILDANGLAAEVADIGAEEQASEVEESDARKDLDAMLIFYACGTPNQRAVPLSLVSRIEEFGAETIEHSGAGWVVQLRGSLVPLVSLDDSFIPPADRSQAALIFADGPDMIALAVDEVVDIIESEAKIEVASRDPQRLGTAIIGGKATDLLDVAYLLREHTGRHSGWRTEAQAVQSARVLVVDDSPFFRNMLKPLLDTAGYSATIVTSAEEALALRDQGKRFDVILSDLEMPGQTGLEFAKAVRADGDWRETPLVALSSLSEDNEMSAGLAAGFDRYVAKFDRERLLDLLASSLRKDQAA